MKIFSILCLAVLLCCSCKKDDKIEPEGDKLLETRMPKSDAEKLSEGIRIAYNSNKYTSESFLKYSVEVTLSDTSYFKGVMKYNIPEKALNVKTNGKELSITTISEKSQSEQFLFDLNELYTLPFSLSTKYFNVLSRNDSVVTSTYLSKQSGITYTIETHPLTDIIQTVKFEREGSILNNSKITFTKYITVNRIPVSMLWKIKKENNALGTVNISRISYPKN